MFHRFSQICSNASYCGSSDMIETEVLVGRPQGGTAILWKSDVVYDVKSIKCESSRLSSVLLTVTSNVSVLLINVYMPCDGENLIEFNDVLNEISLLLHKYVPTYFISGGDNNTDFNRNSLQTDTLNKFMDAEKCINVTNVKNVSIDHTFSSMNMYTDHIINGNNRLFVLLSILFSAMLLHGYCPKAMMFGTMIPIPKTSGTTNSENFRAITLSTTFAKLFDVVIQRKCTNVFHTSDLQFGFKCNTSTAACTFVLQEVISFYNDQNTNVYCTLLDASKAFDRIEFCTLFRKLIKRNMCSLFVRLLLYMYVNQSLVVRWNSCSSDRFSVSNGVKQGGIISPILFCVYINDLLDILERKGIGCYIGSNYCGAIGYADDLILICPSLQGTKEMLLICEEYANSHNIKFNAAKSQLIVFSHTKTYTNYVDLVY